MSDTTRSSPATLHDVAREAGVSLATASRSLNGSTRRVNDQLKERVLQAAEALGYVANHSAQAIAKGTTSTVALVVSDIADPYFSTMASGVIRGAENANLIVTMAMTERSAQRELELVRALRGGRPRVLILTGSRYAGTDLETALVKELQAFEETGGRVVIVSQRSLPFDTVQIDNHGGAKALAEALVGQGYRRFAAFTGVQSLLTSRDRLDGFRAGLAEHGVSLDENRVYPTDFTREGGVIAADALLEHGVQEVDCVFAVNDVMAVGALSRLHEAGVRVPDDVAIAGFDDISTARDVTPALTTVSLPLRDVGSSAIELALTAGDRTDPDVVTITGEVVLRASTPPRSA
ncbi:MAG: LacI family transcriptional regulator [Actinobacteria bacterium]|nr:LacI family transcriptional regulator [Actinomycetota bacterium]MBU1608770.1 LacI family transcriptional regulator [Actinomycetota bacterium]MBU2314841.1 LacI family transcriptional regulator [Actinomycetota bacterium]MBU2385831.1 LacI family transcriptional regulator [Actinomycetota bacterium]